MHRVANPVPLDHPARTAVVVDRDDAVRTAVASALDRMGFQVIGQSADPAQAGPLTRELRPDVVVLAIGPGPDDVPVLAEVTADRIAPVVVLSDDSGPDLVAAVRDAGAHGFLPAFPSRVALLPAIELAIARFAEIARLTAQIDAATRRLETRKLIDRAKGIFMKRLKIDEPEAHKRLQAESQKRRISLPDLAKRIIEADECWGSSKAS